MELPPSEYTTNVSIIDTTSRISGFPAAAFAAPNIPGAEISKDGVSYSFLLKRTNPASPGPYDTLVFDLGVRKDFENSPTPVVETIKAFGVNIGATKSVYDILKENDTEPAEVGGVVWSHYHMVSWSISCVLCSWTLIITGPYW